MTQSLRQSIEILQMSSIELLEKIDQEFLENPFLEDLTSQQTEGPLEAILNRSLSGDVNRGMSESYENSFFPDSGDGGDIRSGGGNERDKSFIENVVKNREGLIDHLLWQARMTAENDFEFQIFEEFITSLSDDGFYSEEVFKELVGQFGHSVMKRVKSTVQGFDPHGCGSSGVSESLAVQCSIFFKYDKIILEMIERFYDDVLKLDYSSVAKKMSLPIPVIIEKSKLLQHLSPFPGRLHSASRVQYVVPDVEVKLFDGEIIVIVNDEWIPKIKLSKYYLELLRSKKIKNDQKEYFNEKFYAAQALIRSISHRHDTIKSVVSSIMDKQRDFLEKGPGHLKFLTHHDIASEVEVHESTVSRVANSKFVETSWGIFPIKYFFVSKIKGSSYESIDEHSSDLVKSKIQGIISSEDSGAPLSDDAIVSILGEDGVKVARRTIAKYRGILNIPSSNKRKRLNMIKS